MKRHPSSSFDEGFHLERRALTPRGSPTKNHHPVPLKRGRRKREEEEEREAGGGGGGARSIICSTFDERGEGAEKSKGGSSNPPLSPMDKPADLAEIQRFMAFISEDRRGKERLMDLKSATV